MTTRTPLSPTIAVVIAQRNDHVVTWFDMGLTGYAQCAVCRGVIVEVKRDGLGVTGVLIEEQCTER